MYLFTLRNELKVTHFQTTRLNRRNARSRSSVISPESGVIVSVTSYGNRLKTVHLLLESIASGSVRPSRLILWVDAKEAYDNPSPQLKSLIDRGVELCFSDNFGPHTKYFPYLLSTQNFQFPLATADDDQIYPRWWLEALIRSFEKNPDSVNCYRARRIEIAGNGLAPYDTWKPCNTTSPSLLHFATGVSGVIYPPFFLQHLKAAGSEFLKLCPKSDDAWLHVHALRAGVPIRQVYNRALRFPAIPGSQASGLFHSNVLLGQNDGQIVHTYGPGDLTLLHAYAAQSQ